MGGCLCTFIFPPEERRKKFSYNFSWFSTEHSGQSYLVNSPCSGIRSEMDNNAGTLSSNRSLFTSIAAAAGVGCLALFAWSRWRRCDENIASNERASVQRRSSRRSMGQGQSINLARPFDGSPYSPIQSDSDRYGCDAWSITVNPQEADEEQLLLQSKKGDAVSENGSTTADHPLRFKRVIFRSRVEDDDAVIPDQSEGSSPSRGQEEADVVTIQPKSVSPGPIVVTNLRLAEKLKGFSNEEYQNTLQGTLNRLYGSTKILTVDEAKCLALILQQKAPDTLLKTLTTMSNLAAFTINQDLLREHGAIELLINLLHNEELTDSTKVMLVQCIGNMAVNQTNNKSLQCCVPRIVHHFLSPSSSELQRLMCVQALTNLSVTASANQADEYAPIIPLLYQRLWSHVGVNVATLRLLVNLSCVADLVPVMLATETDTDLLELITEDASQDVLVRATTFLCYLASTVDALNLTEDDIRAKATHLEECAFYKLFSGDGLRRFEQALSRLKQNGNEEVRQRAERILSHLKSIEASLVQ